MFGKQIFTAILIAGLCQLSLQSENNVKTPDYSGCNTTFQCFGMPENCLSIKDCLVLLKVQPGEKSGAKFSLYWSQDAKSDDSWVAAGLSDDNKMGDDSVTECIVNKNSTVTTRQGLTYADDKGFGVKTVEVKGITDVKISYTDSLVTCEWTRAEDTTVDKFEFNIKSNKYFILLAQGPVDEKGELKHHSAQFVSKYAVDLEADPTLVTTATVPDTTATVPDTTATVPDTTATVPDTTATVPGTKATATVPGTKATVPGITPTEKSSSDPTLTVTILPRSTKHPQGGGSSALSFSFFLAIIFTIIMFLNN